MTYESSVRKYYDDARVCYETVMGDRWHFGDPDAERAGATPTRACEVMEEKVVALAGLRAGHRALDFGSGIGGPTLHMAKVSGASFVGVTNNVGCTEQARARAAAAGMSEQVTFQTLQDTEYKCLPFEDGTFQAVTFYDSVCHLPDKQAFFREAFRVLAPGGVLVGSDWLQRPFGEHRTEAQIMRLMQPVNDNGHIPWHGTLEGYAEMMRLAGFVVVSAVDLYEGVKCWNQVSDLEHEEWLGYEGPDEHWFRAGKRALDAARHAGVFTVGQLVARKESE